MNAVSRRNLILGASAIAVTPALPALASSRAWARARADGKQDLIPSSGAHFGAYVYEGNDLGVSQPENLESKLGHSLGINHCFQPVNVPLHSARMRKDIAAGRIPMVSWAAGTEARLRQIVAGRHDDWIDTQVDSLAALNAPVLMRLTWEFDLRYTDTTLFTEMWRYVHERFAAAPQVAFAWCPTWRAYRETARAEPFYPGNAYVDWIGADGYARAREDKPEYNYRAFDLMFDTAHAFARDHGKPFIVGETGVHRAASNPFQAEWLTDTHTVIKSDYPELKALVYFHRDGPEGDDNWRVTVPDGGLAQRALAAIATDPHFNPG